MTMRRRNDSRSSRFSPRVQGFCGSAGVSSPWHAIGVHVNRILASHPPNGIWIDVDEICRQRGIQVQVVELNGCHARILPVRGGYIAQLDVRQSPGRRRFSLCHELAHTLFDVTSPNWPDCDKQPGNPDAFEETLCDHFASQLLMPVGLFTRACSQQNPSWDSLCTVAANFGVSIEAAVNRIQDLDVWQCFFIECDYVPGNGVDISFEMRWFQGSKSLIRNPIGSVLLVNKVLDSLNQQRRKGVGAPRPYTFCTDSGFQFLVEGQMMAKGEKPSARFLITKANKRAQTELPLFNLLPQGDRDRETIASKIAI